MREQRKPLEEFRRVASGDAADEPRFNAARLWREQSDYGYLLLGAVSATVTTVSRYIDRKHSAITTSGIWPPQPRRNRIRNRFLIFFAMGINKLNRIRFGFFHSVFPLLNVHMTITLRPRSEWACNIGSFAGASSAPRQIFRAGRRRSGLALKHRSKDYVPSEFGCAFNPNLAFEPGCSPGSNEHSKNLIRKSFRHGLDIRQVDDHDLFLVDQLFDPFTKIRCRCATRKKRPEFFFDENPFVRSLIAHFPLTSSP
ncbi:MAG TPA: hypothetical protein PK156_01375 [Polyangium sp.]|nr:hypothetical protein [Polyangium sp.]